MALFEYKIYRNCEQSRIVQFSMPERHPFLFLVINFLINEPLKSIYSSFSSFFFFDWKHNVLLHHHLCKDSFVVLFRYRNKFSMEKWGGGFKFIRDDIVIFFFSFLMFNSLDRKLGCEVKVFFSLRKRFYLILINSLIRIHTSDPGKSSFSFYSFKLIKAPAHQISFFRKNCHISFLSASYFP